MSSVTESKEKDDPLKLKIPTLKGEHNYRAWRESLEDYLLTKGLSPWLTYDMMKPVLLRPLQKTIMKPTDVSKEELTDEELEEPTDAPATPEKSTTDETLETLSKSAKKRLRQKQKKQKLKDDLQSMQDKLAELKIQTDKQLFEKYPYLERCRNIFDKLPPLEGMSGTNLADQLPNELHQIIVKESHSIGIFNKFTFDVSDNISALTAVSDIVLQLDRRIYCLYTTVEEYTTGAQRQIQNYSKVRGLLRSTINSTFHHLLRNPQSKKVNLRKVYRTICNQLEQDQVLERKSLKNKLKKLKFNKMKTYINAFCNLLSEYELVGGERTNEDIVDMFLGPIPDAMYATHKELVSLQTPIDEVTTLQEII